MRLRNPFPSLSSVTVELTISTAVRNMIGSTVRGRGVDRWYNGVKQHRSAPHHSHPSGHRWHGVLSAASAPTNITIDDSLNFSVVITKKVYPASISTCTTFKITKQRRAMDDLEHGTGVVVTWDAEGGFGHLQIDDGPAVWGFYTDIEMDGYRTLEAGQRVEATYEAVEDQDGFTWRTVHIKPVTS